MLATLYVVKQKKINKTNNKILYTIYPTNNWIIKTMTAVTRKQSKSHINAFLCSLVRQNSIVFKKTNQ